MSGANLRMVSGAEELRAFLSALQAVERAMADMARRYEALPEEHRKLASEPMRRLTLANTPPQRPAEFTLGQRFADGTSWSYTFYGDAAARVARKMEVVIVHSDGTTEEA